MNTATLRQLIKKLEQRDALAARIQKIEAEIASVFGGTRSAAPTEKVRRPGTRKGRKRSVKTTVAVGPKKAVKGRRGTLKGKIIAALRKAGPEGVRVRDLAKQIKVSPQNVHVWFSSTGKSLDGIERVSKGLYRYNA